MLTKKDIHFLKTEFVEHLKQVFVTKEEFITRFDAVMYELQAIREEMAAITYRSREHSDQLDDHEKRLIQLET